MPEAASEFNNSTAHHAPVGRRTYSARKDKHCARRHARNFEAVNHHAVGTAAHHLLSAWLTNTRGVAEDAKHSVGKVGKQLHAGALRTRIALRGCSMSTVPAAFERLPCACSQARRSKVRR